MSTESWTVVSLVAVIQVLSEGVFFAQGILQASNETSVKSFGQNDLDWIRICVPLFYVGTRQISEPCWRWIFGGYGNRITTALGAATITVSVVAASCQNVILGNAVYILLGGSGMGLVRLQVKFIKSKSGKAEQPIWGAGIYGIGLSLWPLLACFIVQSLGHRYAMMTLAAITFHAVPLAMFIQPIENEESLENPEDGITAQLAPALPDLTLNSREEHGLTYQLIEHDSYRIRPSYYVEVLPGIPEEVEYDSDHERDHEMQRAIPKAVETDKIENGKIENGKSNMKKKKKERGRKRIFDTNRIHTGKRVAFEGRDIEAKPFAYTLFLETIFLRLGDQLSVIIIISFLPIFAGYLMPDLRIQEKAFLISLCGISRILAEFPLIALYRRSKKTKIVFICGPLFAAVSLYLTWNSASLDAVELASFGLGIGSGAAAAVLQITVPKESPGVSDTADIVIGVALLGMIPLTRILIQEHAIQGCLLLAAGIYAAAAITSVFNLRKAA